MACAYYKPSTTRLTAIGGQQALVDTGSCGLKLQSEQRKLEIYELLFAKGLEGSFVGTDCPVAHSNRWNECPLFRGA